MAIYASDKQFWGENDSVTIQNAVDYAEKTGLGRVIIPRHNDRTGENIWHISSAIVLPSHMTVVLEDAHLRLCDGVFDNIFRNRNIFTPEGNTLEGEQEGIHILGSGNALLDGGEHNGLVEQMHRDDPVKYPRLSVNLMIFLHNVRHFTVEGLHFANARWWAVCCVYCRWGKIRDLDFRFYADHENQDGVDLREVIINVYEDMSEEGERRYLLDARKEMPKELIGHDIALLSHGNFVLGAEKLGGNV